MDKAKMPSRLVAGKISRDEYKEWVMGDEEVAEDVLYDIMHYGTGILKVEKDGKTTSVRYEDFHNLKDTVEQQRKVNRLVDSVFGSSGDDKFVEVDIEKKDIDKD